MMDRQTLRHTLIELLEADTGEKFADLQDETNLREGLGLDSGATWRTFKDFPHFQLTGNFPEGAPNENLKTIFAGGGLQAVWDAVTAVLESAPAASD